jgi:hypothetical protein
LDLNDARGLWKAVYNVANVKATSSANTVGGMTGTENIANMWKAHFENIYYTLDDVNTKQYFYKRANVSTTSNVRVSNTDVLNAICSQKGQSYWS